MAASPRDPPLQESLRRRSFAQLCGLVEPDDPRLEGVLYEGHRPTRDEWEADAREARTLGLSREAYAARRAALRRPLDRMVCGAPLASDADAPFVLDGAEYRSVWCFYQCLKMAETDPRRARLAAGGYPGGWKPSTGGRTTFRYWGDELAVGSPEHGALIARATEAKVLGHEHVRAALLATGTCLLWMGSWRPQALGRYMPFALMVLRLRAWPRSMI